MKFNCFVLDCPWQYNNKNTGGTLISGSIKKYNTLSLNELKDLKLLLDDITENNSVMFMWATVPLLPEALELLSFYGYKYKSMISWVKKNYGMGYWFRGKTEHLLLGVRGKVKPFRTNIPNIIMSNKVLKHSEKPIESYELIEMATKNMNPKYLELFARQYYKDWTSIGYNITGNDIKTDLEKIIL